MKPVLHVEDLLLMRGGRPLLRGLGLQLQAGDCLAVLGPNGAGKSSLIRAISGEWAAQGDIRIGGEPLHRWPRQRLAQRMAVMTQQHRLGFDFSVREVLALGRLPHAGEGRAAERRVVDEVLTALALEPLADRPFPQLSGGEQQRVQFARALVQLWHRPEGALLLLDEPTSALDLAQQRSVFALVHALRDRGAAVLAVLHDLRLARRHASHALLLRAGQCAAQGPVAESLCRDAVAQAFGIAAEEAQEAL